MHVPHAGKPDVAFKTPTYIIGGSDYSLARQGGFILRIIMTALFFVENIHKRIEILVLCLSSTIETLLHATVNIVIPRHKGLDSNTSQSHVLSSH